VERERPVKEATVERLYHLVLLEEAAAGLVQSGELEAEVMVLLAGQVLHLVFLDLASLMPVVEAAEVTLLVVLVALVVAERVLAEGESLELLELQIQAVAAVEEVELEEMARPEGLGL
jgi:hypothetical protein